MIHATRAQVDGAAADLADYLNDLMYTVRDWTLYPHSGTQRDAARAALDKADGAFAEYVRLLDAWAAGPSGDDRD
jgi:rhodanese-related sulfurtransferase